MDENKSSNLILILSILIALSIYMFFLNKGNRSESTNHNATNILAKIEEPKGKDIRVETKKMVILFNTQGGIIKSLKLKEYKEDGNNEPMELASKGGLFRNSFQFNQDKDLNELEFNYTVEENGNKVIVKFTGTLNNQTIEKNYTIDKDGYTMNLELTGKRGIIIGPRIAPKDRESNYSFSGPIVKFENKVEELKLKKEKEREIQNFKWIAWESLYFTVTAIPKNPMIAKVIKYDDKNYDIILAPKEEFKATLYVGPKDYYILKNLGIEDNIRYGVFAPISKLLLKIMHFFHGIIPNWGVSIILLTIFVKIILHPLTIKGYKSMNKMKEIQPEIQRIKEMYKDDPAKLNQAIMELYRKHKINPFSGCLPLFLQIPVFFALYKTIAISIELRHAPFMLWLTDLSAKDPYYITPVIMGITMFIQQLITSSQSADSMQKMMTYGMPVLLTIIFMNLPSGLVLYFLVNNIISIFEQLAIKHVYR